MRYIHQLFLALDQLLNVLLAGWADETLSARSYRSACRDAGKGRWAVAQRIIDALFVWQDWLVKWRGQWRDARHCQRAYWAEQMRLHMPADYRELQ